MQTKHARVASASCARSDDDTSADRPRELLSFRSRRAILRCDDAAVGTVANDAGGGVLGDDKAARAFQRAQSRRNVRCGDFDDHGAIGAEIAAVRDVHGDDELCVVGEHRDIDLGQGELCRDRVEGEEIRKVEDLVVAVADRESLVNGRNGVQSQHNLRDARNRVCARPEIIAL